MRWTVVIPAKALPAAKSRLLPASVDAAAHRELVEAIRADTLHAARAAAPVARVLLVSDRAATDAPDVLVQTTPGLNGAVRDAAAHAGARWPDDGLAVLVGDLPALRPEHLADALRSAAGHPHAFVADAAGTGTTLLTALPGAVVAPHFGAGSAARHARAAHALEAAAGLRADVDTAADLRAASLLGLGARTTAVLAARGDGPGSAVHLDAG